MDEKKEETSALPKSAGERAWMFNWNPKPKDNLPAWNIKPACEDVQKGRQHAVEWGSVRPEFDPKIGDDVFVIKVGDEKKSKGMIISHRGIVAHGRVTERLGIVDEREKVRVLLDWAQEEPDPQFYQKEWISAYPKGNIKDPKGGWEIEEPTRSELMKAWEDAYMAKKATKPPKKPDNASEGMVRNRILYGPPGTGKTYYTAIHAVAICDSRSVEDVEAQDYEKDTLPRYEKLKKAHHIAFTTFHQSYGYEEFIEGIKPVMKGDVLQYQIENGVFKRFCKVAEKAEEEAKQEAQQEVAPEEDGKDKDAEEMKKKPFVFIIDEINRGNISKIFGELITLIEDSKRAGAAEAMEAVLPYSQKSFSVPQNVYIIGTMNTADRSIAMMDTALRRRFSFVEMMPNTKLLEKIEVAGVNIGKMLHVINERITYLYDREHTIGHAFFVGLKDHPDITHLAVIFKNKVIPLLQEYFYDDYHKIQLVLGDNAKKDERFKFIKNTRMEPEKVFQPSERLNNEYEAKTLYAINTGDKGNKGAFDYIESYQQIYTPQTQSSTGQGTAADAATGAAKDEAK